MNNNTFDEVALREALKKDFIEPPEMGALGTMLREQFTTVAVRKDDTQPFGKNNRERVKAVAMVAPTQTGKSTLIEQALAELEPIEATDGTKVEPKPIIVECPSTFTTVGLAREIIVRLRYDVRSMPADALHNRIREVAVPLFKPTHLVLDEFQRVFNPSGVSEPRKAEVAKAVLGDLRRLMDLSSWPVALVLVGTEDLLSHLQNPLFKSFLERIQAIMELEPLVLAPDEFDRLRQVIAAYCATAKD